MQHTFLIVLVLLSVISCKNAGHVAPPSEKSKDSLSASERTVFADSPDYKFADNMERADTLAKYYQLAKTTKDKTYCDRVIFYSFPNSFKGMKNLFGFDDATGAAPLYDIPLEENVITYFGSIQSIPKGLYYEKYIDICINGYWDADNIREAFGFDKILSKDTKAVCQVLSKRSDKDIQSVFRFIFDGPHPKNSYNSQIYNDLVSKLNNQDSHLADLLKISYEKLLQDFDGHGK